MTQKYGYVADMTAPLDRPDCPVCDRPPVFSWTDAHGEAYCTGCGVPFQLLRDGQRLNPPDCLLLPEWLPVVRRYHTETGNRIGGGTFLIAHDYVRELEERREFGAWVDVHYPDGPC